MRNDMRNILFVFIHIDIGYECIVFSCIVEINLHTYISHRCLFLSVTSRGTLTSSPTLST